MPQRPSEARRDTKGALYVGRFAPSPTGLLHLGSAATALIAAARARAAGGRFILRVEDLDTPRLVRGAREAIIDDLRWLGVTWDEGPDVGGPSGPYEQSRRLALYDEAIAFLAARRLTYLCDCSRAEIARVASAPHAGDDGPRYPGTCRPHGMRHRAFRRLPAVRLAVPNDLRSAITFQDAVVGSVHDRVADTTGDFVLRRGDGVYAYQLAVVVDDLAMGVTEVVRGADLLSSTARQILLARLLDGTPPAFAHVPLVMGPRGERLAKRGRGISIADQRASGRDPADLVRALAACLGVAIDRRGDASLEALGRALDFARIGRLPCLEVGALIGEASRAEKPTLD